VPDLRIGALGAARITPMALIRPARQLDGGEIRVLNPVVPHFFHSLKWCKTGGAWTKEKFPRKATYAYQLEAFRDAVVEGKPFVTTTAEAVKTMKVMDAVYRAAGMEPR
jgi:predicted dehydrogenase